MLGWPPPADARVFLGRLTRLDRGALVRLRPAGDERTALWARLPWRVLVTREVALPAPADVTVGAAALLDSGEPTRRDHEWHWPLPPAGGVVLEELPEREVNRVAAAAAGTLREVSRDGLAGRAVGSRVLREALLDHVAIVVEAEPVVEAESVVEAQPAAPAAPGTAPPRRIEVPQRLIQAVVRMGFLGDAADALVRVSRSGGWIGLAARYGTAWLPPPAGPLTVRPT